MVLPCRRILDNKGTRLPFRYNFNGAYESHPYAFAELPHKKQEPYSKPSYPEPSYKPEPKKNPYSEKHAPKYTPPKSKHDDPNAQTSHGIKLKIVGGNVKTHPHIDAELAAAAVSAHEAVVQVKGESLIVPMDKIDTKKLELACNLDGCALIPDDGNPHNDLDAEAVVAE